MTRVRFISLGAALALLGAPPVSAAIIDFEDLAAANDSQMLIHDEYLGVGVTFVPTDDGATWDGMAAGDPGGWQIDGSNGSTFLGFDGTSYSTSLRFDQPVEGFALDVARAAGAQTTLYDFFQLAGFLNGTMVESKAVYFAGIDVWRTISLTTPVDRVVWFGTGVTGHRYGVDNLRWLDAAGDPEPTPEPTPDPEPTPEPEPQLLAVQIDVRPGSESNPIQLGSRGVVPVVLYGEADFAIEDVEWDSLTFGPGAAPIAHESGPHFDDIDGDGLLDMIPHFRIAKIGLTADDVEVCLDGRSTDGIAFEGCDDVTPVGR